MGNLCTKSPVREPWSGAARYEPRRPGYIEHGQPHAGFAYYPAAGVAAAGHPGMATPAGTRPMQPGDRNLHLAPTQASSSTSGTTASAARDNNVVDQPMPPVVQPEASAVPGPASPQQPAPLDLTPINEQQLSESIAAPPAVPAHPQHQTTFNWQKGKLIGAGAFGRVFQGLDNDTGHLIAVKQVALTKDESLRGRVAEHVKALEAEVALLRELNHPNIVRYLGTERTDDTLNIFLEFVPGGSIASMLERFGPLQESVIRRYTQQILQGLEYLHQKKIMHRDIKGANILVDPQGPLKLADFGASRKIENLATVGTGSKSIRGTPYWMAPEVIKQTGHGRPADIWSLGCCVIEMATGKPPWSNCNTQVAAMFHIASTKEPPPLPENLSAEAKDFLLLCFNRVPKDRPNATRLLRHPWLANIPGPSASLAASLASSTMAAVPLSATPPPPPQLAHPLVPRLPLTNLSPPSPIKEESETARSAMAANTNMGSSTPIGSHRAQLLPAALHMPLAIGPLEQGRRQSLLPQTAASMALASGLPPLPPSARASVMQPQLQPQPQVAGSTAAMPPAPVLQPTSSLPLPVQAATPLAATVSAPNAQQPAQPSPVSAPPRIMPQIGALPEGQYDTIVSPSSIPAGLLAANSRPASQAQATMQPEHAVAPSVPARPSTPPPAPAAPVPTAAPLALPPTHMALQPSTSSPNHATIRQSMLTLNYNPMEEPSWMPHLHLPFPVSGTAPGATMQAIQESGADLQLPSAFEPAARGSSLGAMQADEAGAAEWGMDERGVTSPQQPAPTGWHVGADLLTLPNIEAVTSSAAGLGQAGSPGVGQPGLTRDGSTPVPGPGGAGVQAAAVASLAMDPAANSKMQKWREELNAELASVRNEANQQKGAVVWASSTTGITLRTSTAGATTPPAHAALRTSTATSQSGGGARPTGTPGALTPSVSVGIEETPEHRSWSSGGALSPDKIPEPTASLSPRPAAVVALAP